MGWRYASLSHHLPGFIAPCLSPAPCPTWPQWAYEIKEDGFCLTQRRQIEVFRPRLTPCREFGREIGVYASEIAGRRSNASGQHASTIW
jgi:hypothetical protein